MREMEKLPAPQNRKNRTEPGIKGPSESCFTGYPCFINGCTVPTTQLLIHTLYGFVHGFTALQRKAVRCMC